MSDLQQNFGLHRAKTQVWKHNIEHLNPVQKLRTKLQLGQQAVKIEELVACATYDRLQTCQQLLAFQRYDLFEQLRKKMDITDIQLIDSRTTRQLFHTYIDIKKGMTSKFAKPGQKEKQGQKEQFNVENYEKQKARQALRKLKVIIIVVALVIFSIGALYKYRALFKKLTRIVLNIK